ncbi:hypothetical protein BC940DRAFT_43469 [Gongronella butleri]|nr:hypothetical protein BC940DRAFT_43469 [Gongronella butleri]
MLAEGIHHEAQRKIAYEHMARQEPWRVWEVDKLPESILEKYPVNKLDWERISTQYVKTRTPLECMIQWTTQDHPSINKLPWSKVETERLGQLVQTHGYHGQWEKIASELNTNRTAAQCFSHYQFASNTKAAHKKWTKDDDDALRNAVTVLGDRNWQQVATLVGGRSGQQCLHRWLKSINPAIRRSKWTDEEDQALRGAVAVYGIGNWTSVQRHIPGRTDMQCRERWVNVLDSSLNHGPFSDDEKAKLIALIDQHGKKWSHIAQFMPGRTDNSLLRMWASMERAKKKEEKANQKKKDEANATTSKDPAMKNEKKTAMHPPTSSSSKKKPTASSASSTKSKAKGKAKA